MSQNRPPRPKEQELIWYWSSLLGLYLVLVVLLLSYLLYMLWPPSPRARDQRGRPTAAAARNAADASANTNANANTPDGAAPAVRATTDGNNDDVSASEQMLPKVFLFNGRVEMHHSFEVRLLLLVLLAGALGSYIHAATSFIDYVGNRKLSANWVWWYLLRPFVGMALALVFYFVVRGGFISPNSGGEDMNPFGISALAGLVGMFSQQATDKLSEVFKTLFNTAPEHGDAKRKDGLTEKTQTTTTTTTTATQPATTTTTPATVAVTPVAPTTGTSASDTSSADDAEGEGGEEEEAEGDGDGRGMQLSVVAVEPTFGALSGGDAVVISGMNFAEGSTVLFGGKPAADVTVADANTINATTPPADAEGTVDVTVTSPDGETDSIREGFTYTAGG